MAQNSHIARPYAQAIFELAQDSQQLESWSGHLELLSEIVTNEQMSSVISGPRISRDAVLEIILDIGSDAIDDQVRNLVRILTHYRRLAVIPDIAKMYETLRAEAEGIIEAEVESAQAMSSEHEQIIADALEGKLGRKVRLSNVVNKELIGGVVVRAGDWVIDGSIRAQLNKLSSALGV